MLASRFGVDCAQHLDDAVLERLAADQADIWIVGRLPDQVLAAAEADLQPDFAGRRREQLGGALKYVGVAR